MPVLVQTRLSGILGFWCKLGFLRFLGLVGELSLLVYFVAVRTVKRGLHQSLPNFSPDGPKVGASIIFVGYNAVGLRR